MSMPNPKRTTVRVQKVRLYPDVEMKQVLGQLPPIKIGGS